MSDTGTGIDEATQKRIFEPFFTTKEAGKGTGLGLSTVLGIVEQCGGGVSICSETGQGTTFDLLFPWRPAPPAECCPAGPVKSASGREIILVVDDNPSVLEVSRIVLESVGYTVHCASNGAEALRLLGGPNPVSLVFTDLMMPAMSGEDLADAVRQVRPRTRVLYSSGYMDERLGSRLGLEERKNFIGKPYSMHDLLATVRRILVDGGADPAPAGEDPRVPPSLTGFGQGDREPSTSDK